MHCKTCEYPLWNIAPRTCPECGEPFLPSQFEFRRGTVQFQCPHCRQPHFGLGEGGHLEPQAFACGGCGRVIHEDETILLPADGLTDEDTQVRRLPWIERERLGTLRALWAMAKTTIMAPQSISRGLPDPPRPGPAWRYAVAVTFVSAVISVVPLLLLYGGMAIFAFGPISVLFILLGWLAVGALAVIGIMLLVLLWTLVTHAVLRISGPTARGFAGTFEVMHYSAGVQAINAIPCVGQFIGSLVLIWWAVVAIVVLKSSQKVSGLRAAAAVLTVPLVVIAVSVPLGIYAFNTLRAAANAAIAQAQAAQGAPSASRPDAIDAVASAMRDYALQGDGKGPPHVTKLFASGALRAEDVLARGSKGTIPTTQAGGAVLIIYEIGEPALKSDSANLAVMMMGPDAVAYRVGDHLFCDRGIDYRAADPRLWTVIRSFDPDHNPTPDTFFAAGRVDGTVVEFSSAEAFELALREQNELRAANGLKPLPDPATITANAPLK